MLSDLIVGLIDGDGRLICSQPYYEYQYGQRSKEILVRTRGNRLVTILQDDLGFISYTENRLQLTYILQNNINTSVMQLLGKIAEAVLVRRCRENAQLNHQLFMLARRKKAWFATSNKFIAVGTGLKETQRLYPKRYNSTDPQRDIIWLDSDNIPALMGGSTGMSGIEAGLQVKASLDGYHYIRSDLINNRYEVPIVYFPVKNDFESIVDKLEKDPQTTILDPDTGEYHRIKVGIDFVDIRAYDHDAFEEVKDYYPLVLGLIRDEIDIADLINYSYKKGDGILKNTLMLSALEYSNSDQLILPN